MVIIEPESETEKDVTLAAAEGITSSYSSAQTEKDVANDEDVFEDALDEEQHERRALAQANDMKEEGNVAYRAGNYEDALEKYRLALEFASEFTSSSEVRSICHANRGLCYSKLGKYEETIKECTKALELNPSYLKALVRRGEAHEKLEHFDEAIADMKKIIEVHPSDILARRDAERSIRRLEPLAVEKKEKLKEEMIGKLKELGNSVLGRFGMSVDNFKAVKDPNTGSYSISFQR
ncbi:tetratricopeptide repeat (TPR)-like superfamily protein [Wolffia australiana]